MGTSRLASLVAALATPALVASKAALIMVDVQDCFVQGGSLAVGDATAKNDLVTKLNTIRSQMGTKVDLVVRSRDYHPVGHMSFASTHGMTAGVDIAVGTPINLKCLRPNSALISDAACCLMSTADCGGAPCVLPSDPSANPACGQCSSDPSSCFDMAQAMWPDHCLQSGDSGFVSGVTYESTDVIMRKGSNPYVDAYSAFMDNTKSIYTPLHALLQSHGITQLYITGIATDFCVYWTATDGIDLGYSVTVIEDATMGIGIPTTPGSNTILDAKADMAARGVSLITTASFLALPFPVRMRKDPHLALAHGGKADFRGEHGSIYNLLSARNVSFNVQTNESDFNSTARLVHGTRIAAASWTLRTSLSGRLLHIEYHASEGKAHANHALVHEGTRTVKVAPGTPFDAENVHVKLSSVSRELTVNTGLWEMKATISAFPFAKQNPGKTLLDVSATPLYDADHDVVAPHGLLGQSFDGDDVAVDGARDEHGLEKVRKGNSASEMTTTAQAEGAIEGSIQDYRVPSHFSTVFKYSRFDAVAAKTRNVASLHGAKRARSHNDKADAAVRPSAGVAEPKLVEE